MGRRRVKPAGKSADGRGGAENGRGAFFSGGERLSLSIRPASEQLERGERPCEVPVIHQALVARKRAWPFGRAKTTPGGLAAFIFAGRYPIRNFF